MEVTNKNIQRQVIDQQIKSFVSIGYTVMLRSDRFENDAPPKILIRSPCFKKSWRLSDIDYFVMQRQLAELYKNITK